MRIFYSKLLVKSTTFDSCSRTKSRSCEYDLNVAGEALLAMKRSTSGSIRPPCLIPEAVEERVGIVVSKKGYMNFLEEKTHGWTKRWVIQICFPNLHTNPMVSTFR